MDERESGLDLEFDAMKSVFAAMEPLDTPSRERVFRYIAARLEISTDNAAQPSAQQRVGEQREQPEPDDGSTSRSEFETLAELFDAANPRTDKDRVLVAAYWLQVCEGADKFVSFTVNKQFKGPRPRSVPHIGSV